MQQFLHGARFGVFCIGILLAGVLGFERAAAEEQADAASKPEARFEANVPVEAITQGPNSHWFGYYDKHQFDPSGRYVLGMEVDFRGRTPSEDDVIKLGYVDLEADNKWVEFGESKAWSWQQGCMLQWLPGSESEVIYNDRVDPRDGPSRFVSVVHDVYSGQRRVLPYPIYAVSPDGTWGVGVNFARIDDTRPGYGYKGVKDVWGDDLHPKTDGIFRVDLRTGQAKRIISYEQVATISWDLDPQGKHWFNHLLVNPDGSRFIFLHRAYPEPVKEGRRITRMFTANPDGSGLHVVADHEMVSHFIWKNPEEILAWAREPETGDHFYLYEDQSDEHTVIGEDVLTRDGHCTYSPDEEWILTDTYPDSDRMQHLMLYRPSDGKLVELGKFHLPPEFKGEWRCDMHPSWSRDGRYVCIDSAHTGQRQMYLLDVSEYTQPEQE